eukprot:jgi/Antlo1/2342/2250
MWFACILHLAYYVLTVLGYATRLSLEATKTIVYSTRQPLINSCYIANIP